MATPQNRNGPLRAMVRRKGHKDQTRAFPTKTAAKTWADRVKRERACRRAFHIPARQRIGGDHMSGKGSLSLLVRPQP